ncbi:CD99 antigen-like isoform X2 [Coregonus clupeaformis]|uniref:CD99 antigen-like isoform X2 n=1 Tax=Coregonus clupeaformis TaxID=59861 RepID=UPI001E1C369F|nr:CD99 antigen-like isoform X2 [Coregonus clupeaformis]
MLFHSCWKVDCQFVTGEHSSSDMKSCLWIALLVTLAIGTKTQDFDLSDAFDSDDPIPTTIPKQPKQPAKDPSPGGGFDLLDALGPEEPEKPAGIPPKEGGTDPKPAPPPAPVDPKKPAGEAGSGQIAGIVSGIGVALLGAASIYFAYQKKKLCFKIQGGVDPESGKNAHGAQSDPQVMSNLLRSS